jgi:hypothetical protein
MANASLAPQAISRQTVGAALRQCRIAFATNSRELNAINRAALNLEACVWQFDGATLSIESATETGSTRYHVTAGGCTCKAAQHSKPCWHLAGYRLLQLAQDVPPTPQPRIAKSFIDLQAAADELFA